MFHDEKAEVIFGVTNKYTIDINYIKYCIYSVLYQLVYPIGIDIFPIGYSRFPLGYSFAP